LDAQFADTIANRLGVAGVPLSQPIQSRGDHRTRTMVLEPQAPLSERLRLLQFELS
jgi:hypothetical protein